MATNREDRTDRSGSNTTDKEFIVFTKVEVARLHGDNLHLLQSRSTTIECSSSEEADHCFETIEKLVTEESKSLRANLEPSTTGGKSR